MFTGIIEELGTVIRFDNYKGLRCLTVKAEKASEGVEIGDSVAINGACLTVVKIDKNNLSFEIMPETLNHTNLKDLKLWERVNLERALRLDDRVSGHLVSGHIDGIGIIRDKRIMAQNTVFEISIDKKLIKYISPKGSVAIDGISLTIGEVRGNIFRVYLIPHTLKNTTLGFKGHSAKVNIEVDMTAKQLEALLQKRD
jgi:riboflavin synthase